MGSGILGLDFIWVLILSCFIMYFFHTICPIGPAAVSLFLPIMLGVCTQFGVSPVVPMLALAFITAGNFLLPINPQLSITYDMGYYSFSDMFKSGIIPTVISLVLLSLWLPMIVGVLGV
jgi:sodium-dependent dicarboxylate transporter 2/3/5